MDRKTVLKFLKPSNGRVFLFLLFLLMAWIDWQVGMVDPMPIEIGLSFVLLFLPVFVLDLLFYFLGQNGLFNLVNILGFLLSPVYWYLTACAIVVLD